jgi:hypothetical protein
MLRRDQERIQVPRSNGSLLCDQMPWAFDARAGKSWHIVGDDPSGYIASYRLGAIPKLNRAQFELIAFHSLACRPILDCWGS